MDRKEAILYLKILKNVWASNDKNVKEAVQMAIEALSAETPTGQQKHQLSEETPTNIPTDIISRADAIAYIDRIINSGLGKNKSLDYIRKYISALPSADRPSGEWIPNHDGSWNCSECGLRVLIYAKGNYCPNCGAKMGSDTR